MENEAWRASAWCIHAPSAICLINSEVVHPRSQTGSGKFSDARMKVENREKYRREKKRVDDPEYHQDRIWRLEARRQHSDDTAPDANHPHQADIAGRTAPEDPEYQGNIEERHDDAAQHPNHLDYPHSFTVHQLV
jgi:hypothetical protein